MNLSQRHLLSIRDLTEKDIHLILKTAESLEAVSARPVKKVPTLRGKTVLLCFFEPSTRTRASFEIAAKRLSADAVNVSASGSSLEKGETVLDMVRNLAAMSPDGLVVRHPVEGMPALLARHLRCPVINAGDGSHEHPTQALLDLFTIRKVKKKLKGLTVALVGDILHSRVARSNMLLLRKMGVRVVVAGPPSLIPVAVDQYGVSVFHDVKKAVREADVLMVLRLQKERQTESFFPSLREYALHFGLNTETMRQARKDVVILHPGPVNRGVEIAPEVADGPHSLILEQTAHGVAVRMALLYLLCGGGGT